MSGHNKWSKIKHKKAVTDAKKSKKFSRLSKFLTLESKKSQGNVESPGLRLAIEKAKKANMPNDNIEKAIKKALSAGGQDLDEVMYEFYGPGGVAVLIEAITDNKNRTVNEIKNLLSKQGLELAEPGSALWAFEKTDSGWSTKVSVSVSGDDAQKLEEIIEFLTEHDDVEEVYTNIVE